MKDEKELYHNDNGYVEFYRIFNSKIIKYECERKQIRLQSLPPLHRTKKLKNSYYEFKTKNKKKV